MNKEHNTVKRRELRSKYRGQYIAWVGDKVVAHGKDLDQVMKKAKKHGEKPVIDKVEREGVRVV